jgi:hypothetical protein
MEYKIYKIVCNETDEVYIGKTIQTLEERLRIHKRLDCSSKQIIERDNYYMEQINSTFDEKESIILERYYIETFECVNIVVPGRTSEERYIENKEEIRKKQKEYYEENKDEILERIKKTGKEYRKIHKDEIENKRKEKYTCECGSIIRKDSKSKHEKALLHINYINSK